MQEITENNHYSFKVSKSQFGLVVGLMPFGAFLSCICAGITRHKIGTKKTILLFSLPATFGSILITVAQNFLMVSDTLLLRNK